MAALLQAENGWDNEALSWAFNQVANGKDAGFINNALYVNDDGKIAIDYTKTMSKGQGNAEKIYQDTYNKWKNSGVFEGKSEEEIRDMIAISIFGKNSWAEVIAAGEAGDYDDAPGGMK
jgi:hypothetical protein